MKSRRVSIALLLLILGLVIIIVMIQTGRPPVERAQDYDSLVVVLSRAGATIMPAGQLLQSFFSVPGRAILVNGEQVQIFEYPSAEAGNADAALVSADGSTIGTTMVTWVAPPHLFKSGRLIVLYVGNNPAVITLLRAALGPQFAGR